MPKPYLRNINVRWGKFVAGTRRLCLMNLFLHNLGEIDGESCASAANALIAQPSQTLVMLGMVRCACAAEAAAALAQLRKELIAHPLYSSIHSFQPSEGKTFRAFHARDDHVEIRAKVFALRHNPTLEIQPADPWEQPCLKIADYCRWAL